MCLDRQTDQCLLLCLASIPCTFFKVTSQYLHALTLDLLSEACPNTALNLDRNASEMGRLKSECKKQKCGIVSRSNLTLAEKMWVEKVNKIKLNRIRQKAE